eukprot:2965334-Alexandrium_andersonii.AAC.1
MEAPAGRTSSWRSATWRADVTPAPPCQNATVSQATVSTPHFWDRSLMLGNHPLAWTGPPLQEAV